MSTHEYRLVEVRDDNTCLRLRIPAPRGLSQNTGHIVEMNSEKSER